MINIKLTPIYCTTQHSNKIERNGSVVAVVEMDPANQEEDDQTARALLTEVGLDPDDVNRVCNYKLPMIYFSRHGNLRMCRYLFFRRGADCQKVDNLGCSPLYYAAAGGHLEIVRFLCHECGALDDIRRKTSAGDSPLWVALDNEHFEVAMWLILNGSFAPRDDDGGGGFFCRLMKRNLDHRDMKWVYNSGNLKLLLWAQDAVTSHEDFRNSFLMGTHPKSSSSPVFKLRGEVDVLEIVAEYAGIPKPKELRILRQLMPRLNKNDRVLMSNVVFVVVLVYVLQNYLGLHDKTSLVVTLVVTMLVDVLFDPRFIKK